MNFELPCTPKQDLESCNDVWRAGLGAVKAPTKWLRREHRRKNYVEAILTTCNANEVKVILANLGDQPFEVRRGERIAQLVPAPVLKASFRDVSELSETDRGAGGFGSTGQ